MPPPIPSSLGSPVTTREFSLFELVSRAWGSEYFAPDHRVYQFGGVRFFDGTDMGFTGIYSAGEFDLLEDENGNAINDESSGYAYSDP